MGASDGLFAAGTALGILDDSGSIDEDFFARPLDSLAGMLRSKFRREQLLQAVDSILKKSAPADAVDSDRWYPLLPDGLAGQVYLVATLASAVDATFALRARSAVGDTLVAGLELPLVRASGDGQDPVVVAGSAEGRVAVHLT